MEERFQTGDILELWEKNPVFQKHVEKYTEGNILMHK